ncbi:MAG: hypothetical protein ACIARR_13230 [Phycisphaerales bacterium JB059]
MRRSRTPWTRPLRAIAIGLVGLGATLAAPAAAPEPAPIPTAWEFEFDAGPLRLAWVNVPNEGVRPFFYLTYTVTNYWSADLLYAPDFYLKTDESEILRSGENIPPVVTEELLARLGNPLINDQISILGNVLEGPENARSGVVIWPATDLDVDEIMVFAANLSGESTVYWTRDRETGQRKRLVLRKTLMLRYETPGDLTDRGGEPLELVETRWVMR